MGYMRFVTPMNCQITAETVQRAYVAGVEAVPMPGLNSLADGELRVERSDSIAGSLYIPWPTEEFGEVVLSTTLLVDRERPYHLALELARGTLSRVRNQAAVWRHMGLVLPAGFDRLRHQATQHFKASAISQDTPVVCAEEAIQSLRVSAAMIGELSREYSRQVLDLRHREAAQLGTLLVGTVERVPMPPFAETEFLRAFNAATSNLTWRDVEPDEGQRCWDAVDQQLAWGQSQGLRIVSPPIIDFSPRCLPDWLYLWEGDFDNIASCVLEYVTAAVSRYRGRVHVWNAATAINSSDELSLSDEQKLRLLAAIVETIRRLDQRTPVIVNFDRPWAEYMAKRAHCLSPYHFADALLRADLGVSGFGLDIHLGYWHGGTLPRDPLEYSKMLDRWTTFGQPLFVNFAIPSSAAGDPRASRKVATLEQMGAAGVGLASQAAAASLLLPITLAKQAVWGVTFSQFCDENAHEFPHGGLIDAGGAKKPILDVLAAIRERHLV